MENQTYIANANNSHVSIDDLKKTMELMKEIKVPKPILIVGELHLKTRLWSDLKAVGGSWPFKDGSTEMSIVNQLSASRVEWYDTQWEVLSRAFKARRQFDVYILMEKPKESTNEPQGSVGDHPGPTVLAFFQFHPNFLMDFDDEVKP